MRGVQIHGAPRQGTKYWTAVHEAGHAIVAIYCLDSKLWLSDLLDDGEFLGVTVAEASYPAYARFLLAGMAAELEFGRDWWLARGGARSDLRALNEWWPEWRHTASEVFQDARDFCAKHRRHIQVLAWWLIAHPEGCSEEQAIEVLSAGTHGH
jgi:hypothetical protein